MPHTIRLNRVWELRRLAEVPPHASIGDLISSTEHLARIDLPWRTNGDEVGEKPVLLLTRRFNRPANLDATNATFLAIQPITLADRVIFNGVALASSLVESDVGEILLFPLDGHLRENNRVDLVNPAPQSLRQASVRLIIHEVTGPDVVDT